MTKRIDEVLEEVLGTHKPVFETIRRIIPRAKALEDYYKADQLLERVDLSIEQYEEAEKLRDAAANTLREMEKVKK